MGRSDRRIRTGRTLAAGLTTCLLLAGVATTARAQILHDMTDAIVAIGPESRTTLGKITRIETETASSPVEYNGVVFSANTDDDTIQGWVRFDDGGVWTDWREMHLVYSAAGATVMGGYRGDVFRSGPFALRFDVGSGGGLRVTGAGVFDNRNDVDGRPGPTQSAPPARKSLGESAVDPPPLITRAEWNAESFIGTPVPLANPSYNYMTFHHAAGFTATTRAEGLAQVKAIQDLHQNVRGWSDIGYQFVIDRSGRLYQGRPFLDTSTSLEELPRLAMGAHVGGANTGNIGICLLGCYHPPEGSYCTERITTTAYDTYVQTFSYLSENYGVDPALIRGHRDFSSTACPGDNNYALLCSGPILDRSCAGPQLRVDVQNLISTGIVRPDDLTLSQAFPNPASETATIDYYLTDEGVVTLKIFNAFGREVDTLVDAFQSEERWYHASFDARKVAAGTYFVRLEVLGVGNQKSRRTSTITVVR